MSTSATRTSSIRSLTPESTRGRASLANPGSTPLTKRETPPSTAAVLDGRDHRVVHHAVGVLEEDRTAGDHVDPGPQDALHVRDRLHQPVVGHGGVHHHIGLEGQEGIDVVGGGHAEGAAQPGQLTGVPAHLVGVGHPQADQLEVGSGVDAGDGVAADVAGGPGDDSVGLAHGVLLSGIVHGS